jgi:hypothetical protein
MSQSCTQDTVPTSTKAIQQPLLHKLFCHGNPPQQIIYSPLLSPSLLFDMSYPYLKQGS